VRNLNKCRFWYDKYAEFTELLGRVVVHPPPDETDQKGVDFEVGYFEEETYHAIWLWTEEFDLEYEAERKSVTDEFEQVSQQWSEEYEGTRN